MEKIVRISRKGKEKCYFMVRSKEIPPDVFIIVALIWTFATLITGAIGKTLATM